MKKLKRIIIVSVILTISPSYGFSMHDNHGDGHHHMKNEEMKNFSIEDANLKPNEIILEVHGVVCSFCSFGIKKKLSKLRFVDKKKYNKGSEVNIENQTVLIAIKANKKPNLEKIFKTIRSGGYSPIKAYMLDNNGNIKSYLPTNPRTTNSD